LLSRDDPDAVALLRARLDSRRREERAYAARALALHGDGAGSRGLASLLSSPNTRLGAAEALAAVGDERGLALLRRGLSSRDAETRARAATALGRAGDISAADELRRVLAEGRFEVGAAIALANLGDERARPALLALLEHSALRVEAAEALARLGGAAPELLRDALDRESPPGQVQAALAILILSGEGR
jgi:HEAT repeat protein